MKKLLPLIVIFFLFSFKPLPLHAACATLVPFQQQSVCPLQGASLTCGDNQHCCNTQPECTPFTNPVGPGGITTCTSSTGAAGIETAIGCIPTGSSQEFAAFVLRWSIGIASGIAFLLLIYGAIQIMTSSGDPKRLQAGQELITATISGLLFIIFSVFLLRIIGVDILGIFN